MTLFYGLTFWLGIGFVDAGVVMMIIGISTGKNIGEKIERGALSFAVALVWGSLLIGTCPSYKITDDRYLQAAKEVFSEKSLKEKDGYYILNTYQEGEKISRVRSIVASLNIEQKEKEKMAVKNEEKTNSEIAGTINSKTADISSVESKKTEIQEVNYCPNCGTKNNEYKFCPKCGEKIS